MSYAEISPAYYDMLQPDDPYQPGAPGWSAAPWPGWGENPLLRGARRQGLTGLGCGGSCGCRGCSGVGALPEGSQRALGVSAGAALLGAIAGYATTGKPTHALVGAGVGFVAGAVTMLAVQGWSP